MRLIDADALLKGKDDHERISTHLIYNAPTVDAIPIDELERWSRLYLAPTKEYTDIIEDIIRDYREEQSDEAY